MNITGLPMAERHSIADARRNLPALVRDAENGGTVVLTRRGEPVAVLIGCREFERLKEGRPGFFAAWRKFAESVDLVELALDPDELFGDIRGKETGREVWLPQSRRGQEDNDHGTHRARP